MELVSIVALWLRVSKRNDVRGQWACVVVKGMYGATY
jgi:hypothetical protein